MANKTYYELLKDPRWQEKRLRVMERAGFECQECGEKEKTLHVHHGAYLKGKKPWEYPDSMLHCLCEDCHRNIQSTMADIAMVLGTLGLSDMEVLLGFCHGIKSSYDQSEEFRVNGKQYEVIEGFSSFWGVDAQDVYENSQGVNGEITLTGQLLSDLAAQARKYSTRVRRQP